jgi:hypothetical protein
MKQTRSRSHTPNVLHNVGTFNNASIMLRLYNSLCEREPATRSARGTRVRSKRLGHPWSNRQLACSAVSRQQAKAVQVKRLHQRTDCAVSPRGTRHGTTKQNPLQMQVWHPAGDPPRWYRYLEAIRWHKHSDNRRHMAPSHVTAHPCTDKTTQWAEKFLPSATHVLHSY